MAQVHYTTVVSALAHRCFWELALSIVHQLPPGVSANSYTFNSLASACSGGSEWASALQVQEDMLNLGILPDGVTRNVVLSACEKGAQWSMAVKMCAFRVSTGQDPSQATISFNSALAALQNSQSWKHALLGFNTMLPSRACPDEYSCSTCINSCQHSWQLAVSGLEEVTLAGLCPNNVVYGATLNSCEKSGAWSLALELADEILARRTLPNQYTFNSAMSAADKASHWKYTVGLFSQMPHYAAHDVVSCTALISACGSGSCWTSALALLHTMPERSIHPNAATYNAVLKACCSNGLDTALMVLASLEDVHANFPDVLTYNIVISACSTEGWSAFVGTSLLIAAYEPQQEPKPRHQAKFGRKVENGRKVQSERSSALPLVRNGGRTKRIKEPAQPPLPSWKR